MRCLHLGRAESGGLNQPFLRSSADVPFWGCVPPAPIIAVVRVKNGLPQHSCELRVLFMSVLQTRYYS